MHAPAHQIISPQLLLTAYRSGIFPMSDSRSDDEVFWIEPRERAILPLDGFRLSRSLAKVLRQERFRVTCNADFAAVIEACAGPRPEHPETWISRRIQASYRVLHAQAHAHSLECWQGGTLVGGLYGVAFDRVFCGESMFSRATDASKVALAWLVALLRRAGYLVLDCQFMTPHLASLGAVAIGRDEYLALLDEAAAEPPRCSLPESYTSFVTGVGAGEGEGDGGDGAARPGAGLPPSSSGSTGVSSSGKLIAQSLTQTS
jgi:leucyl/phenylalanyl-tRNA--protein transferase